jgi:hypothetical protein
MYYSQRFRDERFICFVIRLINNYGGSARRYAPVLSLRHAAVSRSYRRYCSFVCGCWLCSFLARWPDELYRLLTFSYVRWWDGGFSQRILGLSPGWFLGSFKLHQISREDLFRVSSVFAWLWLFLHCLVFVSHILLSNGIIGKYEFWASFLMRHVAAYIVRNWVILRPCITCNYKIFYVLKALSCVSSFFPVQVLIRNRDTPYIISEVTMSRLLSAIKEGYISKPFCCSRWTSCRVDCKVCVFWDVTVCSVGEMFGCFGRTWLPR